MICERCHLPGKRAYVVLNEKDEVVEVVDGNGDFLDDSEQGGQVFLHFDCMILDAGKQAFSEADIEAMGGWPEDPLEQ